MVRKKAQVSTTLSWFAAFIIIFFIMAIFVSATIILSGRKRVEFGKDVIDPEKQSSNLKSQRVLFNILQDPLEEKKRGGDLKSVVLEYVK